jgi:hypothetical protein
VHVREFSTCFDTSASLSTKTRGSNGGAYVHQTSLYTFSLNILFSFDELLDLLMS